MAPESADFGTQVAGIATLADPVRRALYRYVVAQGRAVNRDEAASGTGLARHVAKFHLDKLAEEGLLEIEYARPPGKGGPGAGRPAKLYRRSARQLAISLPERRYELAGRVMARAITDAEAARIPLSEALRLAAHDTGRAVGEAARQQAGGRAGGSRLTAAAVDALRDCGYEPRQEAGRVVLTNCPFHNLAQDYTDLVCGMNLELVAGLVDGLGHSGLEARLDPDPTRCCVTLTSERGRRQAVPR